MKLKKYFTSRGPIIGTLLAIIFGILVFLIYFEGYSGMPTKIDRLPVTIVNEDKQAKSLNKQLKTALKKEFKHVQTTTNLASAKSELNGRQTYLIIDIPKNFTKKVSQNKSTDLNFYINNSNQSSVVSGMKQVALTIGNSVSQKIIIKKGEAILATSASQKLKKQLASAKAKLAKEVATLAQTSPTAAQAAKKSGSKKITAAKQSGEKQIKQQVAKAYQNMDESVKVKIHNVNHVHQGINYAMAPFFANLALYLGTVLGAMVMYGTFAKFAKEDGRMMAFGSMQLVFVCVSIIASLIDAWAVKELVGVDLNFSKLWLNFAMVLFSGYELNSLVMYLIGQIGTSLNIFLTMVQVVSGAGMLPVITMNSFFQTIHYISPLYYATQINFNLMYGGSGTNALFLQYAGLILALIVINSLIVSLQKQQRLLDLSKLS